MTKISIHETAVHFAHRLEKVPYPVARFLAKRAEDALGEPLCGRYDVNRFSDVDKKLGHAIAKYRRLVKADATSFGADSGPADLPSNFGDFSLLWVGEQQPKTYTLALEALVQALINHGYADFEAKQTAEIVLKELPPPSNEKHLDDFLVGPALKRSLKVAKHEKVIKAFGSRR